MSTLFATPCLDYRPHLNFVTSLINTMITLSQVGLEHHVAVEGGIPFIDHARNVLAHQFLHDYPRADTLFFLDDDVGWPPEAVLRLLNYEQDIVAGVYPLKSDDQPGFPVELNAVAGTGVLIQDGPLIQASFVPFGFCRMRRYVLDVMAMDQPTYPYRKPDGTTVDIANIFHTGYLHGERWGEDVDFCHRWTAKGGTIWVDPDIEFTHIGRKRWTGNFQAAVERHKQSLVEPAK